MAPVRTAQHETARRAFGLRPALPPHGPAAREQRLGHPAGRRHSRRPGLAPVATAPASATAAAGLRAERAPCPGWRAARAKPATSSYGEDTYFLTPLWQRKGNRSIASFHYPPQRLALRVNPGSLRGLHAVIVLGDNQRPYFEQLLLAHCIHYCPHAVDTAFFLPGARAAARNHGRPAAAVRRHRLPRLRQPARSAPAGTTRRFCGGNRRRRHQR